MSALRLKMETNYISSWKTVDGDRLVSLNENNTIRDGRISIATSQLLQSAVVGPNNRLECTDLRA